MPYRPLKKMNKTTEEITFFLYALFRAQFTDVMCCWMLKQYLVQWIFFCLHFGTWTDDNRIDRIEVSRWWETFDASICVRMVTIVTVLFGNHTWHQHHAFDWRACYARSFFLSLLCSLSFTKWQPFVKQSTSQHQYIRTHNTYIYIRWYAKSSFSSFSIKL